MENTLQKYRPYALSLLRIVAALVLFSYGTQKILGFPAADNVPPAYSLSWIAGLIELVFAFVLLIGFYSRAAAFVLSGEMAFAYFIGHSPRGFFPQVNAGSLAIMYCFVCFYLAFAGGGPWSADAIIRGEK